MDPETGVDAVRNVGIRDGKIARISHEALSGRRVIHAGGLVVAPGFVDLHQHGSTKARSCGVCSRAVRCVPCRRIDVTECARV
jgi:N-acyl-D-aspartate/D-glutamate deacylase